MHCTLFQADAAADKELCEVLRVKLDKMKSECDKLATQLNVRDEAHALLLKKYQLLKQELHEGVRKPLSCLFFFNEGVKLFDWWTLENAAALLLQFPKKSDPDSSCQTNINKCVNDGLPNVQTMLLCQSVPIGLQLFGS